MEVAADQLKAFVERVERVEADIADRNADKSEIYKEARALGYDVKAIKKVVAKRKLDTDEREQQDFVFETYWDAVHGANLVHAHARENIEEFDRKTGEIIEASKGDHIADRTSPAARGVEESAAINPEMDRDTRSQNTAKSVTAENARKTVPETEDGDVTHVGAGESPATYCEYCDATGDVHRIDGEWLGFCHCEHGQRLQVASEIEISPASQGEVGAPSPESEAKPSILVGSGSLGANAGDHHEVADRPVIAAQAGAAVSAVPATPYNLRPNCLRPGPTCSGHGSTTCFACKKAAQEMEVA